MRIWLLLCMLAAGGPLLASAQFYCMTGIPCGTGCTMGDGLCINGRCFDRTGQIEWECMAPMGTPGPFRLQGHDAQPAWANAAATSRQQQPQQQRQQQQKDPNADADATWPQASLTPVEWRAQFWMPRLPSWQPWGFHPFPAFPLWKPWGAPFTPYGPMGVFQDCGGKGPCAKGQFCDAQGVCRADDCESQFKYGCPGDKGELKKVACPHFSGFKECYTSTSEGFRCFKGPSGSSISCATQSGNMGGAVWTSSAGFNGPTAFEWDDEDEEVQPGGKNDAPFTTTVAVTVPQAAAAGKTPATPAATATTTPPAATAKGAASATAAATAKPQAAAGPAAADGSGTSGSTTAGSNQSAFKKVVVEAGPAKAAGAADASATSTATAAAEPQKSLVGGKRHLLARGVLQLPQGARTGPIFTPDGSSMLAAGPGPSIGMVDVDPSGQGVAAGMASGDQKTVVTRRGPNGMSTMSSSVSNGGPAIASSVATSGPSGQQPMQVPQEWDQAPQQGSTVPAKGGASTPDAQALPQQQGTAVNSRDSTVTGSTTPGADTAKPTGVKNAAGSGLRGGQLGVWSAVAAGAVALLLL